MTFPQLAIRTEYNLEPGARVFAPLDRVLSRLKELETPAAAILDRTTFGHVPFFTAARASGIRPLLGVQLRAASGEAVGLIARNGEGLRELYRLKSLELTEEPGLTLAEIAAVPKEAAVLLVDSFTEAAHPKLFAKRGYAYRRIDPSTPADEVFRKGSLPLLATSANSYPAPEDRSAFELFAGAGSRFPQHILPERELRAALRLSGDLWKLIADGARGIAAICDVRELPRAENIHIRGNLRREAKAGIARRKLAARFADPASGYAARLERELKLIEEKKFEEYFLLILDMVRYAKKHMIVGPARGSAAGSLACYLVGITDIDPMEHGLIFERFIDITRSDLPDIDLDFPQHKRQIVFDYMEGKYGKDRVAHIGTTLTWKPKSILKEFGRRMNVPPWELEELSGVMIARSSGDSRAQYCMIDTMEELDVGRKLVDKYPALRVAAAYEGHVSTHGTHAAGLIVCNDAVSNYCTVDPEGIAHIDKKDAEKINILKIDALGLRTLSVIETALERMGERRFELTDLPLDDEETFKIFQRHEFSGIFQFEGDAVQGLARNMPITRFSDISAIGALARPGPLDSGGAGLFAKRRSGTEPVEYFHECVRPYTEETLGIIVYQEQVMQIGREIGDLSWEDVTKLRQAMSKSLGKEFFDQYWFRFRDGAKRKAKLSEAAARRIWDNMNTMGAWSFNKSHSVAYGLLSYWTAYLKAHHPVDFAIATLLYPQSREQSTAVLRDMAKRGISFVPFDPERSGMSWTYDAKRKEILGGFTNLVGIGEAKAAQYLERREANGSLSSADIEKLAALDREQDDLFPASKLWSHLYEGETKQRGRIYRIEELLKEEPRGPFLLLGRLRRKSPSDLNEYKYQVRRTARGKPALLDPSRVNIYFVNCVFDDDTGQIGATVGTGAWEPYGRTITNDGAEGKSWYMLQASWAGWAKGRLDVLWARPLTEKDMKR